LRAVTTRHGIPLIFDEVVTGFRFALGGAQEYYGRHARPLHLGQDRGRRLCAGGHRRAAADIMKHFDRLAMDDEDFIFQVGTPLGKSGRRRRGTGDARGAEAPRRLRTGLRHRPRADGRNSRALLKNAGIKAQVDRRAAAVRRRLHRPARSRTIATR